MEIPSLANITYAHVKQQEEYKSWKRIKLTYDLQVKYNIKIIPQDKQEHMTIKEKCLYELQLRRSIADSIGRMNRKEVAFLCKHVFQNDPLVTRVYRRADIKAKQNLLRKVTFNECELRSALMCEQVSNEHSSV